jgi:sulfur carrier protein ThiS
MRVTVKLYAMLSDYLPPGSERNVGHVEVDDGVTVSQLISHLNLPPELTHLVLLNGVYIAPEMRDTTVVTTEDEFAVFPPIAGG